MYSEAHNTSGERPTHWHKNRSLHRQDGTKVAKGKPSERRRETRELRIDRRKSDLDVMEHVIAGVRRVQPRATSNDRAPRRRRSEK